MAIEKMALVRCQGSLKRINKVLLKCCESGCFHIISSDHSARDANGKVRSLKTKSPYAALVNRAKALADGLGITLKKADYDDIPLSVSVDFGKYLETIENKYNKLFSEKQELESSLAAHSHALASAEKLAGFETDFSEIFACKFISFRFGKIPVDNLPKLEYYASREFIYYHFSDADGYAHILYVTPKSCSAEIDEIFRSLFFERERVPDYFRGNAEQAKEEMLRVVKQEKEKIDSLNKQMENFKAEIEDDFQKSVSKLMALNQIYHLRSDVMAVNSKFYFSGYVPKRKFKEFKEQIESIQDVTAEEHPIDSEANSSPPVMLRNCWLFRPFEMFVKMYGLPDYNTFDPTPYVAVTFMLLFGIMFGDLGQGLLITVFGIILDKWRKVKLAPIMERIGITSAIFGYFYGSVFGNEEIIEPFFKIPSIYQALGYTSAPADIFQISTLLLIAAIAIGVILVLISMAMNVVLNIRTANRITEAVLNPNGIAGMIFYASLMIGIALQLGLGIKVLTAPYVLCLIVLPLVLIFFKEPISKLFSKNNRGSEKKTTVGGFIIENFIELFESCLTYITNTMSFLRVGGFILSHAGMMLVFKVLAEGVGGVGGTIILIFGNLFVIGMEGFLVGIQVLRLEFYEIFSRFYKSSGKPFSPITAKLETEE